MLSTNRLSIHTDIFTQTVQKQIRHMHTYFQSITIHLQDGEYSAIFSGKMLNSMAVEFRAHFQLLPILRLPILASSLLSPKRRPYSSARANQQLCFGSIHPPTILPLYHSQRTKHVTPTHFPGLQKYQHILLYALRFYSLSDGRTDAHLIPTRPTTSSSSSFSTRPPVWPAVVLVATNGREGWEGKVTIAAAALVDSPPDPHLVQQSSCFRPSWPSWRRPLPRWPRRETSTGSP